MVYTWSDPQNWLIIPNADNETEDKMWKTRLVINITVYLSGDNLKVLESFAIVQFLCNWLDK